jgi:two-component system chemotaxis response regulator CheB
MTGKVRVLVVDDSALMRKLIPQILSVDPGIEVVGTAMDGEFGLKKIMELHPHVVTLDLDMPRMDGIEALRVITRKFQLPVIIVSSQTEAGARATLKALAQGAFDFVQKPRDAAAGQMREISLELTHKVKVAAASGVPKMILTVSSEMQKFGKSMKDRQWPSRVVAIGTSTGGPAALQYVFSQIPADFPGCFVVVQHMPEGFTEMFARRLNESCALEVKEAQSGDLLLAGRALICPGNRHMRVRRMPSGDIVVLDDQPPVNGHRPSVDVLFRSVAREYGDTALAVLMTGMGDDGAAGMGAIRKAGGQTYAQDLASCVVDSMPKAAIERGFADRVIALSNLAGVVQAQCATERVLQELPSSPTDIVDSEGGIRRRLV